MTLSRIARFATISAFILSMGSALADDSTDKAGICSKLDFSGISWSSSILVPHRVPFQLALNITGSFEGNAGWSNLADNFDGMGISLGLLNQNLGVGTLQPMMIDMRDSHKPKLAQHFTKENLTSLLAMLQDWQAAPVTMSLVHLLRERGYSELDDMRMVAQDLGVQARDLEANLQVAGDRNESSVAWAKTNLMDANKDIKPDWAEQLTLVSSSPEYRTIQVKEAEGLHTAAMAYFTHFKMTELRSYLFFFDIVVQNGGLPDAVLEKYVQWLKSNPKAAESTRLRRILTLRLPYVRRKYRSDVQARKLSIINGTGKVHQKSRDYKKEFCIDLKSAMPS